MLAYEQRIRAQKGHYMAVVFKNQSRTDTPPLHPAQ